MTSTERTSLVINFVSTVALILITLDSDGSVNRALGVVGVAASSLNLGALSQRLLPGIWAWSLNKPRPKP